MTAKSCLIPPLVAVLHVTASAATLEERVEALERREVHLYQTLEGRTKTGLQSLISERISLSGLVELEAFFENVTFEGDADDDNSSDLLLAAVQLGFDAEVSEDLAATLILLYEEEEDAVIEVDEATLDYSRGAWSARLGRQYVPFGVFPSHMISDPMTLSLGETNETAASIGYTRSGFRAFLWAGNGDSEHYDGTGHINDWGANVAWTLADFAQVGGSYLSDLADTDAELVTNYQDRVAGWSVYAIAGVGPVEGSVEFLGAASTFHEDDLDQDGDGQGDRPRAWNLEVSGEIVPAVELAARVEGSRELAGEPDLQYGLCLSWAPRENVSTSLEYLRGEFDKDFGGGLDSRNLVTAQLAAEF